MKGEPEVGQADLAIVLIAHGSRNAEANADAAHFADCLRKSALAGLVEAAFLELAKPDIPTAVARCASRGSREIVLLPFFLSPGVHVRADLRAICQQSQAQYPGIQFTLTEPLGRHPLLLEVLKERVRLARKPLPRP
jgi:sirohydrochlorin ferrochelatase